MSTKRISIVALSACVLLLTGCFRPNYSAKADVGVTFYVPGAGNVDFGDAGVREGLQAAGYRGEVAAYMWTISFNPAIDQTIRLNARLRAKRLAKIIEEYMEKYPERPVNLVGLSAGSGIAIWALENLDPKYKVENVVLLSSSLWHRYDVGKALERVKGRVFVYYSPYDSVLSGPMKIFGTIDGVFGEDGAGAVGLHSPSGGSRIVNISWRAEYRQYGYNGGHVDSTSAPFVRTFLSKHLLTPETAGDTSGVKLASPTEQSAPVARAR
ncbi:MAG: esterase/lipase family protein [Phycisphaerae bacterium]